MPFDRVICPICDGTEFSDLANGSGLPAYRCTRCSLGIEGRLSRDPARAYQRKAYDEQPIRDEDGRDRWLRFHHDSAVAVDRLAQLSAVLPRHVASGPPRQWVDVGCANGALLTAVRRAGWWPIGVEADPSAAAEVTAVLGFTVVPYPVWMAQARQHPNADVVSFFDSLEHMLDPVGAILTAAAALRSGGTLVIELPDLGDRTDITDWKHRRIGSDFTEHIWHFSEPALLALVNRYAPELKPIRVARPVADRIQFVCRSTTPLPVPTHPVQNQAAPGRTENGEAGYGAPLHRDSRLPPAVAKMGRAQ